MSKIIFCGRGPSTSLHWGHILLYQRISEYALKNNLPIIFQFSSDEKYYRDKEDKSKNKDYYRKQVSTDLIPLSNIFKKNKILFFDSLTGLSYDLIFKRDLAKIKLNYFLPSFGFKGNEDTAQIIYPYVQAMIPTLLEEWGVSEIEILSGKDQNSYFDLAIKLNENLNLKVSEISFLPTIKMQEKMSSSRPSDCLFLSDSTKRIASQISRSISGAGPEEIHRKKGLLNKEKDFCHCFLKLSKYNRNLLKSYEKGKILSQEVKRKVSQIIISRTTELLNSEGKKELDLFTEETITEWLKN